MKLENCLALEISWGNLREDSCKLYLEHDSSESWKGYCQG